MVTRLSKINYGQSKTQNLGNSITIILNAINEISSIGNVLAHIENLPNWSESTNILVGLNQSIYNKHSKRLTKIQGLLPNFKLEILDLDQTNSLAKTLLNLVIKSPTKYIMLTRKLVKINNKFDIKAFLNPLVKGASDVVSGSVNYPDNHWSSGCYQSKLIWSQYKTVSGHDVANQHQRVLCDYLNGPFAIDRGVLLGHLEAKAKRKCPDVLVYPEIISTMSKQLKIMTSHLSSVFDMEPWRDLENLSRNDWLGFATRNGISEFYDDTLDKHFEFTDIEVKVKCEKKNKKTNTMLEQRACMRDLHFMFIDTLKLFDKLGYHFNIEAGSGLGAVKLQDSLPLDIDQDLLFCSQNFTSLEKHEMEWKKLGMAFDKQLNTTPKCTRNVNLFKEVTCDYIGIYKKKWNIESLGTTILPYDLYKNVDQISDIIHIVQPYLKHPFPTSRIQGINTKIRMGDYWSAFRPNPGYYVRGR
uniref:LicD family protein n=1 Tax=Clytia hemisphaerica TaxID=252671 RepID=A0A7M5XLU7_9CNID